MGSPLLALLVTLFGVTVAILLLIFVLVPVCKGIGWAVASIINGIGFLIRHVFEFVFGMIGDVLRFVGAILASILLAPLAVLNVIIGRWSAAGHFANSVRREVGVGAKCLYRVALKRPLRLLFLDSMLEGIEQRVPEAMAAVPGSDKPGRRTGQFPGYTIVGSLKGGGSGAKLYVAIPDPEVQARYGEMPSRVVIKAFALAEGSTLPQILRESRALECAKQLGLVFEHGMDDRRFYYVMPFHDGDHLAIVTRQLHGESDGGLSGRALDKALGYVRDLVATLDTYHRGGLWHKDVKPENVIVHDGRANLVDLGLVTPLRSAMTLTTHGTEYFRDPELVRQALRGVKVHQVNGAKFDVYAAGAVLYFVIENDFPAHGALSRFSRRSPEALKWIVRRAMADYSHRYETAQKMLDDIEHVMRARDPFTVKPAVLPSMRARAAGDEDSVSEVEADVMSTAPVAKVTPMAGSPVPPEAAASEAPATATLSGRPDIAITNWWTGAYGVRGPGGGQPGSSTPVERAVDDIAAATADVERTVATELRHASESLRAKVRGGHMSKRRAARSQVRAAKERAREMRRRASEHRRLVRRERRPSVMLGLIVLGFLVLFGGVVMLVSDKVEHENSRVVVTEAASEVWGMGARGETSAALPAGRYLVLNEVPAKHERGVASRIDLLLERYEQGGLQLSYDEDATAEVIVAAGQREAGELDLDRVAGVLEKHELDGVLVVFAAEGEGLVTDRIEIAPMPPR